MKKILITIIFGLVLLEASMAIESQKLYLINIELVDENRLISNYITVSEGYMDDLRIQPDDGYLLELISFNNEILFSRKFDFPVLTYAPPPEWFDEKGNQIYFPDSDEKLLERPDSIILKIPYFQNGKEIVISRNDEKILNIDVSVFANICNNNGICDGSESFRSCPQECDSSAQDGFCNSIYNGKCDLDCKNNEDRDCRVIKISEEKPEEIPEKKSNYLLYIILASLILALIFLIIFFRTRK